MRSLKKAVRGSDRKQCTELGQAASLLLAGFSIVYKSELLVSLAFLTLLILLVYPRMLLPFAMVWFYLSELMGLLGPMLILSLLFLFILIPMALLRQFSGKDPMRLKQFKQGRSSVLITRDHMYTKSDLIHIF